VGEPGGGGDRRGPFACAQLEFGFSLGPPDGRYLVRRTADSVPERIIVVSTLDAAGPPSRLRRRRAARVITDTASVRLPLSRVTIVDAEPFADAAAADGWLERLRRERGDLEARVAASFAELNRLLRANRAAAADPYAGEVGEGQTLVQRVGYGDGREVADGVLTKAVELPSRAAGRTRSSRHGGPHERLAALVGGRTSTLVCEELVLRARLDLDAGHLREAALQARIALEALLSELGGDPRLGSELAALRDRRDAVARAANAALGGELDAAQRETVATAVAGMRAAVARGVSRR
jgi:hypothetical protein